MSALRFLSGRMWISKLYKLAVPSLTAVYAESQDERRERHDTIETLTAHRGTFQSNVTPGGTCVLRVGLCRGVVASSPVLMARASNSWLDSSISGPSVLQYGWRTSLVSPQHTADVYPEWRVRRIWQHHRPQDVLPSSLCCKFRVSEQLCCIEFFTTPQILRTSPLHFEVARTPVGH